MRSITKGILGLLVAGEALRYDPAQDACVERSGPESGADLGGDRSVVEINLDLLDCDLWPTASGSQLRPGNTLHGFPPANDRSFWMP